MFQLFLAIKHEEPAPYSLFFAFPSPAQGPVPIQFFFHKLPDHHTWDSGFPFGLCPGMLWFRVSVREDHAK